MKRANNDDGNCNSSWAGTCISVCAGVGVI